VSLLVHRNINIDFLWSSLLDMWFQGWLQTGTHQINRRFVTLLAAQFLYSMLFVLRRKRDATEVDGKGRYRKSIMGQTQTHRRSKEPLTYVSSYVDFVSDGHL
jgi:hypothetical protein